MNKELSEIPGWKVYRYIFPNGKSYIGMTRQTISERKGDNHFRSYKKLKVYSAIKEYGSENIEIQILCTCNSDEECRNKEKFYIEKFRTNEPEYGYNITKGGNGAGEVTGETLKKMSESNKKLWDDENFRMKHKNAVRKALERDDVKENRIKGNEKRKHPKRR